jgi:uncharacterized repeat protein (TIGR03803 family)
MSHSRPWRAVHRRPLSTLAVAACCTGAPAAAGGWSLAAMDPAIDGASPTGQLLVRADGTSVGVAQRGGPANAGTIFEVDVHGGIQVQHTFDGSDGYGPSAGLTIGPDGNYYGTTALGGAGGLGVIYRIAPDGSGFSVLHSFDEGDDQGASGSNSSLVLGPDGNFYGVTPFSSNYPVHNGAIYRATPSGDVTILHIFDSRIREAVAGLALASNGRLYSTTASDNSKGCGLLYSINLDGSGFRFDHRFSHPHEGCHVRATMVAGIDGALYGATQDGGAGQRGGSGTLFRFDPSTEEVTVIHRFLITDPAGYDPSAGLSVGPGGTLYGATLAGTDHFLGAVFESSPTGKVTALWSYAAKGRKGDTPQGPPVRLDAHHLIGGLAADGPDGGGALYRVKIGQ